MDRFHKLAGATAPLAQHVEARLHVLGVVFEDRPGLAGHRPRAPAQELGVEAPA